MKKIIHIIKIILYYFPHYYAFKRFLAYRKEIIESGFFNADYYAKKNPDVKKANVSFIWHYYEYGWKERRPVSQFFHTAYYCSKYPDVAQANINPLIHYIKWGKEEGRFGNNEQEAIYMIRNGGIFDEEYYLEKNMDVNSSGMDAATHFYYYGHKEGRVPCQNFPRFYYSRSIKKEDNSEDVIAEIERRSEFESYQKKNLKDLINILSSYYEKPSNIKVLDVGCSCEEVELIAKYVNEIVGINLKFNEKEYQIASRSKKNPKYKIMSGTKLDFKDKSFDLVYSFNVFEHINDVSKAIDEQIRVLKEEGLIYNSWGPIWSSGKGHHIHDDMVRSWERLYNIDKPVYKNNGQYIEDWSHLYLSYEEMYNSLFIKIKNSELTKHIVDYIYKSKDINRMFFNDIVNIYKEKKIKIIFWNKKPKEVSIPKRILNRLRQKYGNQDFTYSNCEILMKK